MSEKKEKQSDDYRIPDWAIGVCLIMVVAASCYKFIVTPITDIDFSDLLSLVLALFSIWLSVRFYRMADEASRDFYNNVFEFTSHTSEILGRIEERFGEKMERIGAGLRDVVERQSPQYAIVQQEKEIEKKEEEQQQIEKERQQLIEELTQKAQMADKEKDDFIRELQIKEMGLARLQQEIAVLNKQLSDAKEDEEDLNQLISSMTDKEKSALNILYELNKNYPLTERSGEAFRLMKAQPEMVVYFIKNGLVNFNGLLTSKGRRILKEIKIQNSSKGA